MTPVTGSTTRQLRRRPCPRRRAEPDLGPVGSVRRAVREQLDEVADDEVAGRVPPRVAGRLGVARRVDPIPELTMNDDADVVAVCKLAGLVDLSNELVDDAAINVTATLGTLLSDSLSAQLDAGLLSGSGANDQPNGVLNVAPNVDGATLLAGVSTAAGQINDAGGVADVVAMSGTASAAANSTVTTDGALVFPNGFAAGVGLKPIVIPALAVDALVYDSTRLIFILNRQLSQVDMSKDYHFNRDATSLRIKARAAVACPSRTRPSAKSASPSPGRDRAAVAAAQPAAPVPGLWCSPTGSRWTDGGAMVTLDHQPGCPLPPSQLDLDWLMR